MQKEIKGYICEIYTCTNRCYLEITLSPHVDACEWGELVPQARTFYPHPHSPEVMGESTETPTFDKRNINFKNFAARCIYNPCIFKHFRLYSQK